MKPQDIAHRTSAWPWWRGGTRPRRAARSGSRCFFLRWCLVGMAAAVLQGVPVTTWDLDVVHRRTSENVERLLLVLRDLEAVARHDPGRLRPNATHLIGPGHVLMETKFGDFGCLGSH